MDDSQYRNTMHDTKAAAEGHWFDILQAFGVDREHLTKTNRPCPLCGGRDRFSFYKKDPNGFWFCRKCGHGNGIDLLMAFKKYTFNETMDELRKYLCLPETDVFKKHQVSYAKESSNGGNIPSWMVAWSEAHPLKYVSDNNPVLQYLRKRGINVSRETTSIRSHDGMPYWGENLERQRPEVVGIFPAMLALVTDKDGKPVSIHRTYLTQNGDKAPVECPKKLARGEAHGVIRLGAVESILGIAEGIETALAVTQKFHIPCWSAVSVGGFKNVTVPEGVTTVRIYGDNDFSFTGQAGAYDLAKRLKSQYKDLKVEVWIPRVAGRDWADNLPPIELTPEGVKAQEEQKDD